ncbi:family 20 glycosylhydrolase [Microbacterium gilvum]|uniref:beta-N-acetylhexosaminidase n=1 Tax=Microbacterium gilvum TaxID=1336204 RepID=A0ABP9AQC0_9MICO
MTLPLVPWPASVRPREGAPLHLAPGTAARAEAEAAASAVTSEHHDAALPDEGYRLDVDAAGIVVAASAPAGARHARATLAQLVEQGPEGWVIRPVSIADAPRYPHRGLMLDVARHFHPVSTVAWLLDRMAELKLTHLHLHLTDDQGWRLDMRSRPALAERASGTSVGGGPGGFYTRADWDDLLSHAERRGVQLVPEIDLPGHTHAVGLAHPELCAPPVVTDEVRRVAAEHGGGLPRAGVPYTGLAVGFSSLRVGEPAVEEFLHDVLGEVCALTPGDLVHIGGDEALGTDPDDYASLVGLAAEIVVAHGKTPVAWHEAGRAPLPRGAVGQFWGFRTPSAEHAEAARAFVARGGTLVMSPSDAVYLDMKYDPSTPLGLTWADGPTSVERSYEWDPDDIIPGLPDGAVRGVEAALWTETIRDRAGVERMAFPRLASAAEIAWSPRSGRERAWPAFRARLAERVRRWREDGVDAQEIVLTS